MPVPPLRISKLDALLFRAPIEEPLRTSFGVLTSRPALLVRAEDADVDLHGAPGISSCAASVRTW